MGDLEEQMNPTSPAQSHSMLVTFIKLCASSLGITGLDERERNMIARKLGRWTGAVGVVLIVSTFLVELCP